MYPFIFSKKIAPRFARHLAFWTLYFGATLLTHLPSIQDWHLMPREMVRNAFSDVLSLMPVYLLAVYSTLYIILPIYLRKRRLSLLFWHALVLLVISVPAGYYIEEAEARSRGYDTDELDILATALHNCMANLFTVTGAAVIIRIMKDYWFRQRENELLAIENIRNKLNLLKMQMHPSILFAALRSIHDEIDGDARAALEMILKLSDLLSYLLYESESELVPLSKEVQMIENYLALKKLEYKQQIDLRLATDGQLHRHRIAPGLLLPLLEIGIGRGDIEHLSAITIHLRAMGSKIHFSLVNHSPGTVIAKDPTVQTTLMTVRERLRHANFQKFNLDLASHADGLTIRLIYGSR
jgi:hypothetical protein